MLPRLFVLMALHCLPERQKFSSNGLSMLNVAAGTQNHQGACSVAASYKPPMLVTRVRLPACASFCGFSMDEQYFHFVFFFLILCKSPATRNRARDHLIAAVIYSQMLYQLSYSRRCQFLCEPRSTVHLCNRSSTSANFSFS